MSPSEHTPDGPDDGIIPDRSEALEFEPVVRKRPKSRFGMLLSLILLAGGSAGAGWFYYGDLLMGGAEGELPIIRALDGPVKVRPENPGGMAVPDRDKLVYERLKGGDDDVRVERLLPLPETPLAPPAPKVAPPAPKVVPELAAKPATEPIVNPATIPKIEEPVVVTRPPAPVEKAPAIVKKVAPPKAPAATPDPVYRVQLAAVRSRDSAASEWKRLNRKNGDLLGGLTLNVVRVDLGADKGIFFRLRAGPLAGEAAARKLCGQLSGRKIGCLIVRPGE